MNAAERAPLRGDPCPLQDDPNLLWYSKAIMWLLVFMLGCIILFGILLCMGQTMAPGGEQLDTIVVNTFNTQLKLGFFYGEFIAFMQAMGCHVCNNTRY